MYKPVYSSKKEGIKVTQVYDIKGIPFTVQIEIDRKHQDPALPDEVWLKQFNIGKSRVYQFAVRDMNYPCIALKNYILMDAMSQASFIAMAKALYTLIVRLASMNLYLYNPKIEDFVVVVSRTGLDSKMDMYLANPNTLTRRRNRQTGIFQRLFKSRNPLLSELETSFYFMNDIRKLYQGINTPFLLNTNLGNMCGDNSTGDEIIECLYRMTQNWAYHNTPRVLKLKVNYLKMIWSTTVKVTKTIHQVLAKLDDLLYLSTYGF